MHRANLIKCPKNLCSLKKTISTSWSTAYQSRFQSEKRDYYNDLGVPSNATQAQIKLAYYKLSKMYHPDVTKESDETTIKFRAITEAYEVLGNYSMRKKYDRGIFNPGSLHKETDGSEDMERNAKVYEDRAIRKRPLYTGRTPIYNFDEFYRMHYGQSLEKDIRYRKAYDDFVKREQAKPDLSYTKLGSYGLHAWIAFSAVAIVAFLAFLESIAKAELDTPKTKEFTLD